MPALPWRLLVTIAFLRRNTKTDPLDFHFPNPWQIVQAKKYGYHMIVIAVESADHKSVLLFDKDVRKVENK
jgi:hypothetical protein